MMKTQMCGRMGCHFMVTKSRAYGSWLHVDTHGVLPKHPAQPMVEPTRPPRPVVRLIDDGATLDTGHALLLFDSWQEAMDHAERIMRDYRVRATYWVNVILPAREHRRRALTLPFLTADDLRRMWRGGA